MQAVIELPDALAPHLTELARRTGVSEADVLALAVTQYLEQGLTGEEDSAFGMWRDRTVEGLVYQETLRSEWQSDESRH